MKVVAAQRFSAAAVRRGLAALSLPAAVPLFLLGRALQHAFARYTRPDERRGPAPHPVPILDEATAELLG